MAVIEGEQGRINGRDESIRDGKSIIHDLRMREAYHRERLRVLHSLEEQSEEEIGRILGQISAIELYIGSGEPENGLEGNGTEDGIPKLEPSQETS